MDVSRYLRMTSLAFPLVIFLFLIGRTTVSAQPDGSTIFNSNCKACHTIGRGTLVGPDLKDVQKRRSEEWLLKWIKSSTALVNSGDKDAVDLFNKFNKIAMPDQNLSKEEMLALLAYIKTEGDKAPAIAAKSTATEQTTSSANRLPLIITATIFVLLILVVVLTKAKNRLKRKARAKEGLPELPIITATQSMIIWLKGHKKSAVVGTIALLFIGSMKGWYALAGIGIAQGYQPDQPIAYSHKVHAGDMKIACIYCHSGAEKGKMAGIPSANVCMNCHKAVKEGTTTGTKEIAKLYDAVGWNPETRQYDKPQKPIQWVRVHNLPDLAYFNHSQHTKVGGIVCQTCHGEMQTFTVAKQFAPLTMGWCIDCHRRTQVKTAGNHYYDNFRALTFNGRDTLFTVEKIGGTECSKCHY